MLEISIDFLCYSTMITQRSFQTPKSLQLFSKGCVFFLDCANQCRKHLYTFGKTKRQEMKKLIIGRNCLSNRCLSPSFLLTFLYLTMRRHKFHHSILICFLKIVHFFLGTR